MPCASVLAWSHVLRLLGSSLTVFRQQEREYCRCFDPGALQGTVSHCAAVRFELAGTHQERAWPAVTVKLDINFKCGGHHEASEPDFHTGYIGCSRTVFK